LAINRLKKFSSVPSLLSFHSPFHSPFLIPLPQIQLWDLGERCVAVITNRTVWDLSYSYRPLAGIAMSSMITY